MEKFTFLQNLGRKNYFFDFFKAKHPNLHFYFILPLSYISLGKSSREVINANPLRNPISFFCIFQLKIKYGLHNMEILMYVDNKKDT